MSVNPPRTVLGIGSVHFQIGVLGIDQPTAAADHHWYTWHSRQMSQIQQQQQTHETHPLGLLYGRSHHWDNHHRDKFPDKGADDHALDDAGAKGDTGGDEAPRGEAPRDEQKHENKTCWRVFKQFVP